MSNVVHMDFLARKEEKETVVYDMQGSPLPRYGEISEYDLTEEQQNDIMIDCMLDAAVAIANMSQNLLFEAKRLQALQDQILDIVEGFDDV